MCGICGELSFDVRAGGSTPLAAMTATIAAPGPRSRRDLRRQSDGSARAGLPPVEHHRSARRSESAHRQRRRRGAARLQRRDLQLPGAAPRSRRQRAQFRSRTRDSEVIAHLFEESGDSAIDALDGMFAIGIWNTRAGTLTLARDRAGKKPLFIYQDGARSSSRRKSRRCSRIPSCRSRSTSAAVPYYFLYGYVPHPQTFYRRVTHLEPGTVATFDRRWPHAPTGYWQLTFPQPRRLVEPRHRATRPPRGCASWSPPPSSGV